MAMSDLTSRGQPKFWRRRSIRRILQGVGGVILVIAYGVVGYVALGWKPFDALYMVMITISTVGFGEVQPVTSTLARVHTMTVIFLGSVAVTFMIAGFVQFLAEGEIRTFLGHQ